MSAELRGRAATPPLMEEEDREASSLTPASDDKACSSWLGQRKNILVSPHPYPLLHTHTVSSLTVSLFLFLGLLWDRTLQLACPSRLTLRALELHDHWSEGIQTGDRKSVV